MLFCCAHHWSCENDWDATCKDISLHIHVDEGQICLFTVYPVHWLYYMEGTFFRKKNNADTVPILKKIYNEH